MILRPDIPTPEPGPPPILETRGAGDRPVGIPSIWPSFALVAAVAALVGAPLRIEGYDFNPVASAARTLWKLVPWIAGVAALRVVLAMVRRSRSGRPPLPDRRDPAVRRSVLRQARSGAALVILFGLLSAVFTWGKLLVPLFNPRLWDAQLEAFDRALHLGLDPNFFVLGLVTGRFADVVVDWTYAQYGTLLLFSTLWFILHPDLRQRHRFARGYVLLWLLGLSLHWLVPALGPVYVSPELLTEVARRFPRNFAAQARLLHNYQDVASVLRGASLPIKVDFGIAAMPSLHVGLPAYLAAHCHAWKHPLRHFYVAATILLSVGAVATCWHYAVDVYVGVAMAVLCWAAVRRPAALGSAQDAAPGEPTARAASAES